MDVKRDWDDKKVMSLTTMEAGGDDRFRLKITLPTSGREVTSEWIRKDKRREALFAWVAAVKAEVEMDIQNQEVERKEQASIARAQQSRLVGSDGAAMPAVSTATLVPAGVATSAPAATAVSPASLSSNPDDYISDQLKRALIREAETADAAKAAQRAHEDAVANLAKWQKLQDALTGRVG